MPVDPDELLSWATPEERVEIIRAASRVGHWLINLAAAGQGLSEQGRIVLSTVEENSEPRPEMSERQVYGGLPESEGEGDQGSEPASDDLAIPSFLVRHDGAEPIEESRREEKKPKASAEAWKLGKDRDYLVERLGAGRTLNLLIRIAAMRGGKKAVHEYAQKMREHPEWTPNIDAPSLSMAILHTGFPKDLYYACKETPAVLSRLCGRTEPLTGSPA
jgi:hypothetical protein